MLVQRADFILAPLRSLSAELKISLFTNIPLQWMSTTPPALVAYTPAIFNTTGGRKRGTSEAQLVLVVQNTLCG